MDDSLSHSQALQDVSTWKLTGSPRSACCGEATFLKFRLHIILEKKNLGPLSLLHREFQQWHLWVPLRSVRPERSSRGNIGCIIITVSVISTQTDVWITYHVVLSAGTLWEENISTDSAQKNRLRIADVFFSMQFLGRERKRHRWSCSPRRLREQVSWWCGRKYVDCLTPSLQYNISTPHPACSSC